jgi:hypothetical protein
MKIAVFKKYSENLYNIGPHYDIVNLKEYSSKLARIETLITV